MIRALTERRAPLAWFLVAWISIPTLALAEGGAICALAERAADAVEVKSDVYLGLGDEWYTRALKKKFAPPVEPPTTSAELRLEVHRIVLALQASAVLDASSDAQALKKRLLAELALLDSALAVLVPGKPVAVDALKGYGLARLDQTTTAREKCKDATYTTASLFFEDGPASEQVVLRVSSEVSAGVGGIVVPVVGKTVSLVTVEQASEFRAALEVVRAMVDAFLKRELDRTTARLTRINQQWSNYLEHGFSQYPWEAAVNSVGELSWRDPPKTQWVFLHPEVAVVFDARSLKHASASGALLIHALGFIGYPGSSRNWFVGASATGAVTTSTQRGLGAGGTIHFGHAAVYQSVPHISLAVLLFATDTGKLGPFVGLSADLWRLVSDSGETLFNQKLLQP